MSNNISKSKCEKNKQKISESSLGEFSFNRPIEQGNAFLTASEWNELITYIISGYALNDWFLRTDQTYKDTNGNYIFAQAVGDEQGYAQIIDPNTNQIEIVYNTDG